MHIAEGVERSERRFQEKGEPLCEKVTRDAMNEYDVLPNEAFSLLSAQVCRQRGCVNWQSLGPCRMPLIFSLLKISSFVFVLYLFFFSLSSNC